MKDLHKDIIQEIPDSKIQEFEDAKSEILKTLPRLAELYKKMGNLMVDFSDYLNRDSEEKNDLFPNRFWSGEDENGNDYECSEECDQYCHWINVIEHYGNELVEEGEQLIENNTGTLEKFDINKYKRPKNW